MFKVIIADDEKIVRIAMRNIIDWESHGFNIVGLAQDGSEVLNILNENGADLIITDLKMKGLNGIELIDKLKEKNFRGKILVLSNHGEYELVREAMKKGADDFEKELGDLIKYLEDIMLPHGKFTVEELKTSSNEEITRKFIECAREIYKEKEEFVGSEQMREIERVIILRVVDTKWMDHIDDMDHLKQGIGLRAYKQQDPTQAYQMEGSAMFDEMINNIKIDTVRYLFHVKVEAEKPQRERVAKETGASHGGDSQEVKKKPVKKEPKVGRNDLCPCGSGKKYKSCCGREVV